MRRRIYGLENEYGIIFTSEGKKLLPVERVVKYLFEKLITTDGFWNVFLENGSRFYLDTGYHPEYATPECASPLDVVKFDKAGERILEDLRQYAEMRVKEEDLNGTISIFKNNSDFTGNSYGCHENYLVSREASFYQLAEMLIPFFVTRQIFSGAGKVVRTRWHTEYQISQRAQHIYQKISGATTNDRSIINTRDEPHADKNRYRRLHVIVGDSNMSEYTTYLKIGTTALILEMIEDFSLNVDLALRNPVKAIKDVAQDLTCKEKIKLDNGRKLTPIEIQKEYLDLAVSYYAHKGSDPMIDDILQKWAHVLQKLEEDPKQLNREIDWVIKRELIESYLSRHKTSWNDDRILNKILMLDLQYHDVNPMRGLFYLLERNGLAEKILSDEEIDEAKTVPPQDTRAKLRGDFIKEAKEKKIKCNLDWSYIGLGNHLNLGVICNDPFQTTNEKVSNLQARIPKLSAKNNLLNGKFLFFKIR